MNTKNFTVKLRKITPNTHYLETPTFRACFSYETLIAYWGKESGLTFITDEKYSHITTVALNTFLGMRYQDAITQGNVTVTKREILEMML